MSPTQQKVMQYLPVVFAVFQIFFLTALVVYYIFQTLLRILQQYYITRKFYGHDESLGRQAQRAGEAARESAKEKGETGGFLAQAKRDLALGRPDKDADKDAGKDGGKNAAKNPKHVRPTSQSKRVTPPKSRPTAGSKGGGDAGKGRPTPTRKQAEAAKNRPKSKKSAGKKKR